MYKTSKENCLHLEVFSNSSQPTRPKLLPFCQDKIQRGKIKSSKSFRRCYKCCRLWAI